MRPAFSPNVKNQTQEVSFAPVDNARLAMLCGALDENLRQVETALDVSIARRAERFSISGAAAQVALAVRALRKFYDLAARELTVDEIQLGLVEITRTPAEGAPESPALRLPRKTELSARTPRQAQYLQQMRTHDITFGVGPAGTGKTYLAVAAAVDAFERDAVKRIMLTRPAVEAGEKLGFLPGDLAQKVDPYLRPLYDALYDLMGYDKVGRLFERGALDFAGGTVVHINAGIGALAAVLVLGKRRGWPGTPMPPHSLPLTLIGAGILWFGWFGFNAGSALAGNGVAAQAFVNTHLAASAGMLGWLALERWRGGHATTLGAASGAVAGLVAITPCAGFVSGMAPIVIGLLAAIGTGADVAPIPLAAEVAA